MMSGLIDAKMSNVRTTLTIDDDLGQALREQARQSGRSFKGVVNDTLRRGLSAGEKPPAKRKPFRVRARRLGWAPGVDPLKLNQLVDELEVDRFLGKTHGTAEVPES